MKKPDIIQMTLTAMRSPGGLMDTTDKESDASDDYEYTVVLPVLNNRLPEEVDIRTCAEFGDLQVDCCPTCHTFYPFEEMYLEGLPGGELAWICCAVRSALRPEDAEALREILDLERALGGDLRDSALADDGDGPSEAPAS